MHGCTRKGTGGNWSTLDAMRGEAAVAAWPAGIQDQERGSQIHSEGLKISVGAVGAGFNSASHTHSFRRHTRRRRAEWHRPASRHAAVAVRAPDAGWRAQGWALCRDKTLALARRLVWWPGLLAVVEEYARTCPTCRHVKADHLPPAGLLYPLPVPTRRDG